MDNPMGRKNKGKSRAPKHNRSPYDPSNKTKPIRNDRDRREAMEKAAREKARQRIEKAAVSNAMAQAHHMDPEEIERMLEMMMAVQPTGLGKLIEPPVFRYPEPEPVQLSKLTQVRNAAKAFYMSKNGIMQWGEEPETPLIGARCPERDVRRLEGDIIDEFEATDEIQMRVFVPQQYAYRHRPDTKHIAVFKRSEVEDLFDGTYLISERALEECGI